MSAAIDPHRLAVINGRLLRFGQHITARAGTCATEAVAYIAGEPHSMTPSTMCPMLTRFVQYLDDGQRTHQERTRILRPLLPRLVGTRSTTEVEQARARLCLDWLVRTYTPAMLALAGRNDSVAGMAVHALRDTTSFSDDFTLDTSLLHEVRACALDLRVTAKDRRGNLIRSGMADRSWNDTWHATRVSGAYGAFETARLAPRPAHFATLAWEAAWACTWAAVVVAPKSFIATVGDLQASAVELLERMIDTTEEA